MKPIIINLTNISHINDITPNLMDKFSELYTVEEKDGGGIFKPMVDSMLGITRGSGGNVCVTCKKHLRGGNGYIDFDTFTNIFKGVILNFTAKSSVYDTDDIRRGMYLVHYGKEKYIFIKVTMIKKADLEPTISTTSDIHQLNGYDLEMLAYETLSKIPILKGHVVEPVLSTRIYNLKYPYDISLRDHISIDSDDTLNLKSWVDNVYRELYKPIVIKKRAMAAANVLAKGGTDAEVEKAKAEATKKVEEDAEVALRSKDIQIRMLGTLYYHEYHEYRDHIFDKLKTYWKSSKTIPNPQTEIIKLFLLVMKRVYDAYTSKAKFIHGDLHTSNVLVKKDGRQVKLYDFDLSFVTYQGNRYASENINLFNSPSYLSNEKGFLFDFIRLLVSVIVCIEECVEVEEQNIVNLEDIEGNFDNIASYRGWLTKSSNDIKNFIIKEINKYITIEEDVINGMANNFNTFNWYKGWLEESTSKKYNSMPVMFKAYDVLNSGFPSLLRFWDW